MKRVHKFIREFNLKYFRKFKCIPAEDFGTRFVADGNAHSITFETEVAHEVYWDLIIVKNKGKYIVTITHMDCGDIDREKSWVTFNDAVIEKLITNEIREADEFCVKNKHIEDLNWKIAKSPSDLYDGEVVIDFGELPANFNPVETLEPVPEFITLTGEI